MQKIPKIYISKDPLSEHVYRCFFEDKIFKPDYMLVTNYLYEEIIKHLEKNQLRYPKVSPLKIREIYTTIFEELEITEKVYYLQGEDLWFINVNCLDHFIFDERSQNLANERGWMLG